ncbi:inorganic diphosphatase [Fulvimarina sp. MAC8]|uniref:inorganic diphosphatase n=1 Tax=Fulvimarina sp. MAC8 TaxID=3162874 RepID=UPI0032F00539
MRVEAISRGKNPPDEINVIIEVPMGGEPVKYELDKESGALFVDRILFTPMRYPGNYGFVPHTLSDDGDPIDVLVLNDRPFVPGCVLPCRPIGVLVMEDDAGQDEKVVAVPTSKMTRQYENVKTATDMPEILLKQVEHFFEHYKDLEPGKWVKIHNWGDVEQARKMIREAVERYDNDKK